MTSGAPSSNFTSLKEGVPTGTKEPGPAALGRTQQLFFFHHVPKTGGSTIIDTFKRKFGSERVIAPRKNKSFLVDVTHARKFLLPPSARRREFYNSHIVGHHASLSIIEGRESQYHTACFWRHPADWFLSYYNWRTHRDKGRQKRAYSFSDFVKSLAHNPMSQDFLLYCGDVPGWPYFFMSDRQKFERALSISDRFDLFADISSVDDYLGAIGLAETEGIIYSNTISKKDKPLKFLDPETRHRLELVNPVDYYIYRLALGQDRAQVISEARRALTDRFQFRDVVRLIVRPYYRFKVKFIPFF